MARQAFEGTGKVGMACMAWYITCMWLPRPAFRLPAEPQWRAARPRGVHAAGQAAAGLRGGAMPLQVGGQRVWGEGCHGALRLSWPAQGQPSCLPHMHGALWERCGCLKEAKITSISSQHACPCSTSEDVMEAVRGAIRRVSATCLELPAAMELHGSIAAALA